MRNSAFAPGSKVSAEIPGAEDNSTFVIEGTQFLQTDHKEVTADKRGPVSINKNETKYNLHILHI